MLKSDTTWFMCLKGHYVYSVQNGLEGRERLDLEAVKPVGLPLSPGNGDGEKWTELRKIPEVES